MSELSGHTTSKCGVGAEKVFNSMQKSGAKWGKVDNYYLI